MGLTHRQPAAYLANMANAIKAIPSNMPSLNDYKLRAISAQDSCDPAQWSTQMGDIGEQLAECLFSLHKGKLTIYDYMTQEENSPFPDIPEGKLKHLPSEDGHDWLKKAAGRGSQRRMVNAILGRRFRRYKETLSPNDKMLLNGHRMLAANYGGPLAANPMPKRAQMSNVSYRNTLSESLGIPNETARHLLTPEQLARRSPISGFDCPCCHKPFDSYGHHVYACGAHEGGHSTLHNTFQEDIAECLQHDLAIPIQVQTEPRHRSRVTQRRTDIYLHCGSRKIEIDITSANLPRRQNNWKSTAAVLTRADREKRNKHLTRCQSRGLKFYAMAITPLGGFSEDARAFLQCLSRIVEEKSNSPRWWFWQHVIPNIRLMIRHGAHEKMRQYENTVAYKTGVLDATNARIDATMYGIGGN